MDECKPLPSGTGELEVDVDDAGAKTDAGQGLTLVYISAQRKHFLWVRGSI